MANVNITNDKNKGLIIGAAAIVALVMVFGVGLGAGRMSWRMQDRPGIKMMDRRGGMMPSGWGQGGISSNQARLSGVVTAVNGSSFTLAGGGVTNSVTTNSSTQWDGADSVKVNDSALVFGTTSNGTFTATQVVVNP